MYHSGLIENSDFFKTIFLCVLEASILKIFSYGFAIQYFINLIILKII